MAGITLCVYIISIYILHYDISENHNYISPARGLTFITLW